MVENNTLPNRVLFDWVSATFDFIPVVFKLGDYDILPTPEFEALLSILGVTSRDQLTYETSYLNGFKKQITIGEHIKLLYSGKQNKFGNQIIQLLMSGSACREFENNLNGSYSLLFHFLSTYPNTTFTRIDLAVDMLNNDDFSIYELEKYFDELHFVSAYEDVDKQITFKKGYKNNSKVKSKIHKKYLIRIGKYGSNNLTIYDKRLERDFNDQHDLNTDVWERYEMRFTHKKAEAVIKQYLLDVKLDDQEKFSKYVKQLLYSMLDLKIPLINGMPTDDTNISRWDTDPKWLKFLDNVSKIKLDVKWQLETTIESRKSWAMRSLKKVFSSFYLAFNEDDDAFGDFMVELIQFGIEESQNKDISMINNYRKKFGLSNIELDIDSEFKKVKLLFDKLKT